MKIGTRINSALRTLRLLALMEHSPKYGDQLASIAPDLFFSTRTKRRKTDSSDVKPAHIYMTLHRLVNAKLIQRRPTYRAPASMEVARPGRVAWYELTALGRKTLRESRDVFNTHIGASRC